MSSMNVPADGMSDWAWFAKGWNRSWSRSLNPGDRNTSCRRCWHLRGAPALRSWPGGHGRIPPAAAAAARSPPSTTNAHAARRTPLLKRLFVHMFIHSYLATWRNACQFWVTLTREGPSPARQTHVWLLSIVSTISSREQRQEWVGSWIRTICHVVSTAGAGKWAGEQRRREG